MKQKRGVFFSVDALIALTIILLVILVAFPIINTPEYKTNIHYDILTVISTIKTGEISGLPQELKPNPTKIVINQIGEFYSTGNLTLARNLANYTLGEIETQENIGLWFGNTLIWSRNNTEYNESSSRNIDVARYILTGLNNESGVSGFSARAFLEQANPIKYIYFGGYIGDGNITLQFNYTGEIDSAEIELVINEDFDLYINGNHSGNYSGSVDEFTPVSYKINETNISFFHEGINQIEIKGDYLHVTGGFLKIAYTSNTTYQQPTEYNFPGITGLINIYDGLYIPGEVQNLEIQLHMNSTQIPIILRMGNITIFNNITDDEEIINFDNAELLALFGGDYDLLNQITIPLRLGMENLTIDLTRGVDVFSATDLSPSMQCSNPTGSCWTSQSACEACGGIWMAPINEAKNATSLLTDLILNNSINQMGVFGYTGNFPVDSFFHPLSKDNDSIQAVIAGWSTPGGTSICRGINYAAQGFLGGLNIVVEDRLLLYYDFNEGVDEGGAEGGGVYIYDETENQNNGELQGNTDFSSDSPRPSPSETSVIFDGDADYINLSINTTAMALLNDKKELTFAVWVKSNSPPSIGQNKVIYQSGSSWGLTISFLSTNDIVFVTGGLFGATLATGVDLHDNKWHHIAITYNSSAATAYIDGLEKAQVHSIGIGFIPNDEGYISPDKVDDFEGLIDELRIYDYPLSQTEVASLAKTSGISCENTETEIGEVCDGDTRFCTTSGGYIGQQSCLVSCGGYDTCTAIYVCGDGIISPSEECDDWNTNSGDGCSSACQLETNRSRHIIVMSDGLSTIVCEEQEGVGDLDGNGYSNQPEDHAIQAACDAKENYGIIVHAIAFGTEADTNTLNLIATLCEPVGTYSAGGIGELGGIYEELAQFIITQYSGQTINITAINTTGINTKLYPDSYIKFNYTTNKTLPFGIIITSETNFTNKTAGTLFLPEDTTEVLETKVTSYSGSRWTDMLKINDDEVYRLENYGNDYITLGDPYTINILNSLIDLGPLSNEIILTTGSAPIFGGLDGSEYNKIISTIAREIIAFTEILGFADGCLWDIEFEDGTLLLAIPIPDTYDGSEECHYDARQPPENHNPPDESNDAFVIAILELFRKLDLDNDRKLDVKFTAQGLQIGITELSGVPWAYTTEVEARVWKK